MEFRGIIYKITNKINGKIYIGQTVNSLGRRMSNHFSPNRKANTSAIDRSINKNGRDNFTVEHIFTVTTNINDLNEAEIYFIEYFNSMTPIGYNLHSGGNNHKASEETCQKISDSKKGIPNLKLRGKPKSKAHKEKLRQAKLGKKQSSEHIKKATNARIGLRLKPIIAYKLNSNEFIYIPGIKFSKNYGFEKSNVHRVLNGTKKSYNGYVFKYVENK